MECLTSACVIRNAFVKISNFPAVRNDTVTLETSLEDRSPKRLRARNVFTPSVVQGGWQSRVQILCKHQQDSSSRVNFSLPSDGQILPGHHTEKEEKDPFPHPIQLLQSCVPC